MLQSFILGILVSYLQRKIKCVFKNCGYPEEARAGPPLPIAGRGGGNQSCN